mgnify:CR=1 FL=1
MWRYFKAILTFGIRLIFDYFLWINKYSKEKCKASIKKKYQKIKGLLNSLIKSLRVDIKVIGKENIPDEVCYFVSNHTSNMDPFCILANIDKPIGIVAKKEVENYPFVGKALKVMGGVFMDRNDVKQALTQMLSVREELIMRKKSWLIFPEGKTNKDRLRLLNTFHPGSFRPAMKAGVPIVPIVVYGTHRILKLRPVFKSYPVYVEFLKPIYPDEYKNYSTEELAEKTEDMIQRKLSYFGRRYDDEMMSKLKSKKYKYYQN